MIMGECAYKVEVLLGADLLVPSQGNVYVAPFEVVVVLFLALSSQIV